MSERRTGLPGTGGTDGTPTAGGRTDVSNSGLKTPVVVIALCGLFFLALCLGVLLR